MSRLSAKCGGGGWTLVMKLDRDKVKHIIVNTNTLIAAERQRGSILFLTTSVVFPEPTRPSLSPRFIYSRDLDLCPSVCLSVNGGDEFSYVCGNKGLVVGGRTKFVCNAHAFHSMWSSVLFVCGQASVRPVFRNVFGRHFQVTMALFLCATMHQGDERFSVQTRGKQCAFMSLAAVITAQNNPVIDWSTTTFDNVL